MGSIYILARPGLVIPMEGRRRQRVPCSISDDTQAAVRVEESRYYRRLIRDGEIVVVEPVSPPAELPVEKPMQKPTGKSARSDA